MRSFSNLVPYQSDVGEEVLKERGLGPEDGTCHQVLCKNNVMSKSKVISYASRTRGKKSPTDKLQQSIELVVRLDTLQNRV